MSLETDEKMKKIEHHKEYYIPRADLHLLAGNVMFRVHSYFFIRESSKFRDQLVPPASPGMQRQGTSDATAIILDVSPEEFESFLWVFYNPKYSLYDTATVEDWISILNLAHQWEFPEVKNFAIREIAKVDLPVAERIALYQAYELDNSYLLPLYGELCARDEAPTFEETDLLGMKTSIVVFRARERLRSQPSNSGRSPLPEGLEDEDIYRTITSLIEEAPVRNENGHSNGGGPATPSSLKSARSSNGRTTYENGKKV